MENQKNIWNKIAPSWNAFRNKSIDFVSDFLKNKSGKVLDLGCGSGRNCIGKNKEYYCVDFSQKMLDFAKENLKSKQIKGQFFQSKTSKLLFEDNFFDSIICISVLHCIQSKVERQKTIKEIYRTLKPGKTALISVWSKKHRVLRNKPKESCVIWNLSDEKINRYNYAYDSEELKSEIEDAGFTIIKETNDDNINFLVKK